MRKQYLKLWVLLPFFHILMVYGMMTNEHWLLILILGFVLHFPIHHLGNNFGHHKLFSHNAFAPAKWYPYLSAFLSSISFFGDPLGYALVHRLHHKYADTNLDPHSPKDGRFHAYIGWIAKFNPTARQKLMIADLVRKYKWMLSYSKFEFLVPVVFYAVVFSLNFTAGYIVLFASLLAFHLTAIASAFAHSVVDKVDTTNNAVDNMWAAYLLGGSFLHKQHHDNVSLYDCSYNGYVDYWAIVIKRFFMEK